MNRTLTTLAILALTAGACSPASDSAATAPPAAPASSPDTGTSSASTTPPAPGTVVHGDASTNLDTTPISAADVALYNAVMGGASAMLSVLTPSDREALAFAKRVEAGQAKATPETQHVLAQARALQHKDEELARMQGIEARYLQVKAKIDAVIGPRAQPASKDDAVAKENRRYLEAHRQTIERFQSILRDPLSRPVVTPEID